MCQFKAKELIEKRRSAFEGKDLETGVAILKAIDEARWKHEETGCHCWADALLENPNPLEPR